MMDTIDMEEIENSIDVTKILEQNGFNDFAHYSRYRVEVEYGLMFFGDRFTRRLGRLLKEASLKDSLRIFRMWQNECNQASMLVKIKIAQKKAEDATG